MARVAMHAVPPRPTVVRRRTGSGDPPVNVSPPPTQTGRGARDTLGVGARGPPAATKPGPPLDLTSPTGRGSLATCGDIEPNPGPTAATCPGEVGPQVLPLDMALLAADIRGHFTLRPDPPGRTHWWCPRCGMSWQATRAAPTCPDGCAPLAGTPQRGHHSWLRHRQLVTGKRSTEHQALR